MSAAITPTYVSPGLTAGRVTDLVTRPLLQSAGRNWWIAFGVSLLGTALFFVAVAELLLQGVGVWGINTPVVWGFAIANYVWWIGIGNAGTLISAMLLLTRQRWRASINRFAESMTLFAAAIAGMFPILHLGRPYLFYWLVPYPNTMTLWPQWRSPLVWDLFAIASYLIFSLIFWYVGMIPDLATIRDRATRRSTRRFYGALALGWAGSSRQWRAFQAFYGAMAALGVPLVVSVHSVVGLDFAFGLMPGWQETIFPPYFVVGAMFSGFATVVVLAALIRSTLGLQALVTRDHFDAMAKVLLFASLVMTASYALEWFSSWYGGSRADRFVTAFGFTGTTAPLYWAMLLFNCGLPNLFWWRRARRNLPVLIGVAVLINVGMWLERILIIVNTLSRGFAPAQWGSYWPTVWDWTLFAGTFGLFGALFLLLVRVVPIVSMHEMRALLAEPPR